MRQEFKVDFGEVRKGDVIQTVWASGEIIRILAVESFSDTPQGAVNVDYERQDGVGTNVRIACVASQPAGRLLHRQLPEGITNLEMVGRMHLGAFWLWKHSTALDAYKEPDFQGFVDGMEELIVQWQLNRPVPDRT